MKYTTQTTLTQNIFRILLGSFMIYAGIGHLTFARVAFQAQVPRWLPMDKDLVVVLSGIVELAMGFSFVLWNKQKVLVGVILAIFFVLIFPGNVNQYINRLDSFGLNTDTKRLVRLLFQPVLVLWALWSSGAIKYYKEHKKNS